MGKRFSVNLATHGSISSATIIQRRCPGFTITTIALTVNHDRSMRERQQSDNENDVNSSTSATVRWGSWQAKVTKRKSNPRISRSHPSMDGFMTKPDPRLPTTESSRVNGNMVRQPNVRRQAIVHRLIQPHNMVHHVHQWLTGYGPLPPRTIFRAPRNLQCISHPPKLSVRHTAPTFWTYMTTTQAINPWKCICFTILALRAIWLPGPTTLKLWPKPPMAEHRKKCFSGVNNPSTPWSFPSSRSRSKQTILQILTAVDRCGNIWPSIPTHRRPQLLVNCVGRLVTCKSMFKIQWTVGSICDILFRSSSSTPTFQSTSIHEKRVPRVAIFEEAVVQPLQWRRFWRTALTTTSVSLPIMILNRAQSWPLLGLLMSMWEHTCNR